MGGHVARTKYMRNAYKILFIKPEKNGPLGRSGCRWNYKTKIDMK